MSSGTNALDVEREVLEGSEPSAETRSLIEEAVSPARFPDVAPLVRNGVYFGSAQPSDGTDLDTSDAAVPGGAQEEVDEILDFATEILLAGLDSALGQTPVEPATDAPATPPTPQEAYEAAEAELRAHVELRKRTQQRVRELEREEAALHRVRDRAKEFAKAHAKHVRSLSDG